MPFGVMSEVYPRNRELDGFTVPLERRPTAFCKGHGVVHCKVYGACGFSPAKVTKPIEMPFGLMTHMGQRNRIRQSRWRRTPQVNWENPTPTFSTSACAGEMHVDALTIISWQEK